MASNSPAIIVPPPAPPGMTNMVAVQDGLRDIVPPVYIFDKWGWVIAGGVLFVLLVAGILYLALRKKPLFPPPLPLIIPPHERARQKLSAALDMLDRPKPFCVLVSDAVRLYLEERFELRAPERTTEEFLFELRSKPVLSHAQKQSLGEFLEQCDLVKFARLEPTPEQLQPLYEAALRLIDETSPMAPAAVKAPAELSSAK
jgi:hypothetical protein